MNAQFAIHIARVGVQIALIAFALYRFYGIFGQSKALAVFHIAFFYGFAVLASHLLGLSVLEGMLRLLFIPFLLVLLIVYQEDIRFSILNERRPMKIMRKRENFITAADLRSVVDAMVVLADMKRGALVVIRRSDGLYDKLENDGYTDLDCKISRNAIVTIFSYDTPLHDGAIIIDRGVISKAGCILPRTRRGRIVSSKGAGDDVAKIRQDKMFGTRHRAALGITEASDAVAIVVSEESQAISVCFRSRFYYDQEPDDVVLLVEQFMGATSEAERG